MIVALCVGCALPKLCLGAGAQLQLSKPTPNSPTTRRRTPSRGHHKKTKSLTRSEAAIMISPRSTEAEEPPAPAAKPPAVGHAERTAPPVAVAGATPKQPDQTSEEPKRIRLVPLGAPGFAFDPTQYAISLSHVRLASSGCADVTRVKGDTAQDAGAATGGRSGRKPRWRGAAGGGRA